MSEPHFFRPPEPVTLAQIVEWTGAQSLPEADLSQKICMIAALDQAEPSMLAFLENSKYADQLLSTRAGACLIQEQALKNVPAHCTALIVADPQRSFARVAARLFPKAQKPQSVFGATGISPGCFIHPEARLEPGVIVDPGAVIGPGAEIGAGTLIGAHAVIGPDVRIGRDCAIGASATLGFCFIGNRVTLHSGVRIGQDGFGFAMGREGHLKIPQIGRVIIQDDVEIGANSTIDRGANRDTLIGEGTKIDNLVQIAHNVVIGRHCVIVSQVGISGSTQLGDFVVLAGQVGLAGHLKIGSGAQLAGQAGVMTDVPAAGRWVGTPARPALEFFRQVATLDRLARGQPKKNK